MLYTTKAIKLPRDRAPASYTWGRAIHAGALVDITSLAKEADFAIPVAVTAAVHARFVPSARDARLGQSLEVRLSDLLKNLKERLKGLLASLPDGDSGVGSIDVDVDHVVFDVVLVESGEQHTVHMQVGISADEGIFIVMFENEAKEQ